MSKMKRMLSLALVAIFVISLVGGHGSLRASAETVPMTWKEMDKGYVIFEMDDASEELETYYNLLTGEYGFPMCSSCWSVDLDTDPEKVARLRWLEDHGGEITSHTHNNLGVYGDTPLETIEADFKASAEAWEAHGFNVNGIMVQGKGGSELDYYSYEARARVEPITSKYFYYSDRYGVSTQYDNKRNWIAAGWSQTKKLIDDAISNKSFTILATHGYEEVTGMPSYTHEYLIKLLDYLKEKEDAGELEVVTYRDLFKRFAEWETPVDLGDTKHTVDFYALDGQTLIGSSVAVEGGAAVAPSMPAIPGITYTGWTADITNVTDNMKVSATAQYADGTPVDKDSLIDLIAYVNLSSGNDDTGEIGNPSMPYATLDAAVTAVDAYAGNFNRVVQFTGTSSDSTIADHANMITIRGVDTTSSVISGTSSNSITLGGPTTFDNMKFGSAEVRIGANYHEMIFTDSVATAWAHVQTGNRWGCTTATKPAEKVTINGGNIYRAYIGSTNANSAASNNCYGVDYVQAGGNLMHVGIAEAGPVNFKGNVNITLNVPIYYHATRGIYLTDNGSAFNGNALQIIYNNASKTSNATYSGDLYPTVDSVAALGGKYYEMVVDASSVGSTLSTTETAGTYTVNNAGPYTAVAYDANGAEKARVKDGVLTVPSEGVYTVKWVLTGDVIAYVDAANGNDSTAKLGFDTAPYATLASAIAALDALTGDVNRIVQLSAETYTDTSTPAHKNMITIRGGGDTTVIAAASFTIGGPTTFENLKILNANENELRTNHNELILGNNVTTPMAFLCVGNRWTANGSTVFPVEKVTINSGRIFQARLGSNNAGSASANNCYGIEYVQNGGSVYGIYIGRYGAVNFKGDVNITLNVPIGDRADAGIYLHNTASAYNGNALQIIYNNGAKNSYATQPTNYPTVDALAAMGGEFYELAVDAHDSGATLSTTETAGTYTLTNATGYDAVAYDANGVEKARSEDGVLTVPAVGSYTVSWVVAEEDDDEGGEGGEGGEGQDPVDPPEFVDATVYATDLSQGKFYVGYMNGTGNVYRAGGSTKPYTITFEYYMPETPSWPVAFSCTNGGARQSGDQYLYAGHHTFEATWMGTSGGVFVPGINTSAADITELYVWNYQITVDGEPVTTSEKAYASTSAPYTADKMLSEYDWCPYMMIYPPVTEITFGDGTHRWGRGHYTTGVDENTLYEISFDYYVPEDCATLTMLCATSISPTTTSGSLSMDKTAGIHSFSWKGYKNGKFYPRIQGTVGQTLYIWNYRFTVGGEVVAPSNVNEAPGTAAAVGGDLLCNYRWYNSTGVLKTHAAQIRADGALRFISTIGGFDITRNADGTANYDAATVTIKGVSYDIVTAGTVIARKTALGDAELTVGKADVSYEIPAVKLQNPANAPTGITVEDGAILFTGVITNIPQHVLSETLVARAYVAYTVDGVTKYLYGNSIERSYQGILDALGES